MSSGQATIIQESEQQMRGLLEGVRSMSDANNKLIEENFRLRGRIIDLAAEVSSLKAILSVYESRDNPQPNQPVETK